MPFSYAMDAALVKKKKKDSKEMQDWSFRKRLCNLLGSSPKRGIINLPRVPIAKEVFGLPIKSWLAPKSGHKTKKKNRHHSKAPLLFTFFFINPFL